MFPDKPPEYWWALAAGAGWLATRRVQGIPLWKHLTNSVISVLLTLAISPTLAGVIYGGETGAAILCMAVGVPALNTVAALAEDKKWMRGIVERLLGKGGGPDA